MLHSEAVDTKTDIAAGETRTISIDLYDQVQAMNDQGASETALILLCLSFFFLSAVYLIDRKKEGLFGPS